MIYTVTLNPAIDKTVLLPEFTPGQVNRVQNIRVEAGGKGVNVSKCLKALDEPSVAMIVTAGQVGQQLTNLPELAGIPVLQAKTLGQTRTNLKIVDPTQGQTTDINEPGPQVEEKALAQLLEKLLARARPGDIVVLSGSLPPGAPVQTYADWVAALSRKGMKVFLDADAEPMALGIGAGPYLIKPNEAELSRVLGRDLQTLEAQVEAGKELQNRGIARVVISMGASGALFLTEEGVYQAQSLSVTVKSTVGAGDAMVAALAVAESRGMPMEEAIRLAMAMGAASVMQEGSGAPEQSLVQQLTKQVILRKWQ